MLKRPGEEDEAMSGAPQAKRWGGAPIDHQQFVDCVKTGQRASTGFKSRNVFLVGGSCARVGGRYSHGFTQSTSSSSIAKRPASSASTGFKSRFL